jgi:hypothetical protein
MSTPRTEDFEKLGVFYLGKRYDVDAGVLRDDLVLYDARDLTTHAVIIGMTGSGKTGLGIGLIEEAAIDHIPVIAIDPKGDLGNLLLGFPELRPADFLPWVNARSAADQGMTPDAYAQAQAKMWRDGLAEWGQDGARIAHLRESAELALYTPGSSAGRSLAALESFAAPAAGVRDDADLYRDRIQATASGLLALLGIDADPLTSREHILVATLLQHHWDAGKDLDLGALVAAVQSPPVTRIGVMEIDAFYPANERFALAVKLNNLLASPGFAVWRTGEPIDAARLLYTETGKPRVSVISIAHLSDAERMFFVTLLLSELLAWMRAQQGTSTLRAILYMDELQGYMPPVASPPSKALFLTLLKQARAYGLGLVLATQNPVDLDYKGLANSGTWFIGRLQTERDQARVMEALAGAAGGERFDRARTERVLAGLGKRRFLLHDVHEDHDVVFETRWTLSYLAGPLTREQIRALSPPATEQRAASAAATPGAAPGMNAARADGGGAPAAAGVAQATAREPAPGDAGASDAPPVLPPGIAQYFLPAGDGAQQARVVYEPRLLGAADVAWSNSRHAISTTRRMIFAAPLATNPLAVDWAIAEPLDIEPAALETKGREGARYLPLPGGLGDAKKLESWKQAFARWLRQSQPVRLRYSPTLKLASKACESERDFRIRLQDQASAQRDATVAKLRKKYAPKKTTLEERLRRAQSIVARKREQESGQKLEAAVSFGTAVLGALLGRKSLGVGTASRMGSAVRSAGRATRQRSDVARAEETVEALRAQLTDLDAEAEREIAGLATGFDAQGEALEEILVQPKAGDVQVRFVALGWMPMKANGAEPEGAAPS